MAKTGLLPAAIASVSMLAAMATGAHAQEVIKLTAISGLPPASIGTRLMNDFYMTEVDKILANTGDYKIEWTRGYAGSVAKQPDVFEAVGDGVGDLGYVNTLFEGDKLPLEQITYVTPFGTDESVKLIGVIDKLRGEIPAMDEAFKRHKQEYLAGVVIDTYHLETVYPVEKLADLEGHKIGAPGLSANWLTNTGATPVAGSLSTYYNSMQTGVYEGIIIFESAIAPFKFYEVAKYIALANIGSPYASAVTINDRRMRDLPEQVREAFRTVGEAYQAEVAQEYVTSGQRSLAKAKENGAVITPFPAEERTKWANALPNIAQQWAKDLDDKGLPGTETLNTYMQLSRDAGIQHARAWDKE